MKFRCAPNASEPFGFLCIVAADRDRPKPLTVDEYYGWIFENGVPGLPEEAQRHGLSPLAYMRRFGAFLVEKDVRESHRAPLSDDALVSALAEHGITVARRTVTKYRKAMDIPSSRQRRDWSKAKK